MKNNIFWIKAMLLTVVILLCVWYLAFAFIIQFYTSQPGSDGLMYYPMAIIHLLVIVICILYFTSKINYWKKRHITK
jgi:predicted membrane-bound mannosyltransferase